ncbi:MAG: ornithine carbamoyltransferase [Candidatus Cloacimonetes bacterium]|nr:ornithine carbamoyltransferase [Candidatus Cloacimonadota bacterium]
MNLFNKSLLTLKDFTKEQIIYFLDLADYLKAKKKSGEIKPLLEGKNIVLIFDKPSTRTRCAFEVAAFDEKANVTFLTNSQMNKKESIEDTAKILGSYYDAIEYRGSSTHIVQQLQAFSGVPVYNGLTDDDHPTQVLADFMTVREKIKKPLNEIKFTYVGDGRNNMARALAIGAAKVGMKLTIVTPAELFPPKGFKEEIDNINRDSVEIRSDLLGGVKHSDVIYTDVWFSMGEEDQLEKRIALLQPYQVNKKLIKATKNPKVIFMHCLPAFHDLETEVAQQVYRNHKIKEMEVTDEVFRGDHSVVFDQAENRIHTIKAVMVATLNKDFSLD